MLMSFSHSALLCVMMLAPKFQLRSYAATAVSRVLLCISTLDNFYFQKKWPKKLSLNLVGDGQFSFLAMFLTFELHKEKLRGRNMDHKNGPTKKLIEHNIENMFLIILYTVSFLES